VLIVADVLPLPRLCPQRRLLVHGGERFADRARRNFPALMQEGSDRFSRPAVC
jgi:hypothetical protein